MTSILINPILIAVPQEIRTKRLLIRSPFPEDAAELHAVVKESLPELSPWLPWAQEPQSLEGAEIYCREARAKFLTRSDLPLMLFDQATGVMVGASGLHRIKWEIPCFEIGYWCRSSWTGRGIITEAVEAIAGMAFNDLKARRVEIRVDPLNARSCAVAERLGFELEATLKNSARDPLGQLRDTRVYCKIR